MFADIDLNRCIQPRQMHDITGHYNRFDIFDLQVNRKAMSAVRFRDGESEENALNHFTDDAEPDKEKSV